MTTETMDIHEVASLCRAEPETIAQYARTGVLPGTKMGKGWVFLHDDVITFLRKRIAEETQRRRAQTKENHKEAALAVQVTPAPRRRRATLPELPTFSAQQPSP